jgi:D-alanyl-D-alanine carboxypeptidase/D-alanyl-D-alanine-endopeptidase (penicillin-binding protein 4)
MTLISATGPVRDGVLAGDLVIQGGGDPFFVTEDALELRQDLEALGVKRVTGKLIITGDFYMNFRSNAELAGKLLKQTLQGGGGRVRTVLRDKRGKPRTVVYRDIPAPHIAIAGPVQVMDAPWLRQVPLIRHRSPSLVHILKRMNVYSNNAMANMVTETLGGPYSMVRLAALGAGVSMDELRLSNGSGLGVENQLSPRTVCALLVGIQRALRPAKLTIADVFPVAGHDLGTIRRRHLPFATVVKTGTLRNVSTLAGVMLTRAHGPVWFALINRGGDVGSFREQQDVLLQTLMQEWGPLESPPVDFSPSGTWTNPGGNDILLYAKSPRG